MLSTKTDDIQDKYVTIIIKRIVKPNYIEEFEHWVTDIIQETNKFKGYLGCNIICPSDGIKLEYIMILRFNHYDNLKIWENSEIRRMLLDIAKKYSDGNPEITTQSGLEHWFTLPSITKQKPPARYKMISVTFLALFPIINLLSFLLSPYILWLPTTLRLAIIIILTLILMSYVVMPVMHRTFSFWLKPT